MEILNNFSGIKIIITALKSPAVFQLRKIKDVIIWFDNIVADDEESKDY